MESILVTGYAVTQAASAEEAIACAQKQGRA